MDYSLEEDIIKHICRAVKYVIVPSKDNDYKSKFLQSKALLYCVVLLLALKIVIILVSINVPPNIFFADITKSVLENLVNQTRQSIGLPTLVNNEKLSQAAQLKAENMIQYQYFDHTSPSGISPWFWFSKAGYNYKYAGENLAIGFYDSEEVYNAWLNSPSHKANIVNPNYKEIGTAVLSGFGPNNTIIVVQEFGSPLSALQSAVVKNNNVKLVPEQNPAPPKEKVVEPESPKEQVLSQITESQSFIEGIIKSGVDNLPSKVISSILYDSDHLLQNIIYGISFVIIAIIFLLMFLNFEFNFKKQLVFRAFIILVILSVATLTNKESIISFIPHQVLI